jgi:predicted dehydrogenase
MAPPPVPVVLVGAHGHGRWHLQNLDRLARTGAPLRLAGICDPRPLTATERDLAGHVPVLSDLDDLLAAVRPQVTIVCTPIHTHAGLALTAAAAGSHVLLEKPPTPTLAGFDRLRDGLSDTGSACQVGFQSLGSHRAPRPRRRGGRRRRPHQPVRPRHRHRAGPRRRHR